MKQKILLPVLVLSALFLLGPTGDTVYEGATEGGGGGGGTATSLNLSPAPALCTGIDFPKGITATGDAASCAAIADTDLPASVKLDTEAPYWTSHATFADPNTLPEDCDDPMSLYTYTNSGAGPNTHWACTVASTNTWKKIALEGVTNVEAFKTGAADSTVPVATTGALTMTKAYLTALSYEFTSQVSITTGDEDVKCISAGNANKQNCTDDNYVVGVIPANAELLRFSCLARDPTNFDDADDELRLCVMSAASGAAAGPQQGFGSMDDDVVAERDRHCVNWKGTPGPSQLTVVSRVDQSALATTESGPHRIYVAVKKAVTGGATAPLLQPYCKLVFGIPFP